MTRAALSPLHTVTQAAVVGKSIPQTLPPQRLSNLWAWSDVLWSGRGPLVVEEAFGVRVVVARHRGRGGAWRDHSVWPSDRFVCQPFPTSLWLRAVKCSWSISAEPPVSPLVDMVDFHRSPGGSWLDHGCGARVAAGPGFPWPPFEPDVRLSPYLALHGPAMGWFEPA